VNPLLILTACLTAFALVLLVTLSVRHFMLARRERFLADAEQRMRPLAINLLDEEAEPLPELSDAEQRVLAAVVGRYSRKLGGEATGRIGAYFRDGGGLAAELEGIQSRRAWRRAAAAYALGDMACPEAVPVLTDALEDRNAEVRAAAVRSLGQLRDPTVAETLVESLVAQRVPRGMTGAALLKLGADAVPELRRIAGHDDPAVRQVAVTVLGLVGDFGDSDVALQAISDPSAEVRAAAAHTLGRIGAVGADDALEAALNDPEHFVRAEAAEALGKIGAYSALPRLLEIARTDRFKPARAAARAVSAIDPATLRDEAEKPEAGPHLHEAADLAAI
jgi:HEAT repeat protein